MIRHWTAPAVAGVAAAVVTVWVVRALVTLLAGGWGSEVVTVPTRLLLLAAGPAVLCAVPLVVLARAVLSRVRPSLAVDAALGLVGGALVGVVQGAVLLSAWPWQTGDLAGDLLALPALGGLVGGVVAGLVRRARESRDTRDAPAPGRGDGRSCGHVGP